MSIVTYIEFFFPGSFFAESSAVKFKGKPVLVPPRSFGWLIKQRQETEVDGETLAGPFHQVGHKTLIGNFYTLDELKVQFGHSREHSILLSNIENNDYKGACMCRTGNWQPVDETVDVVPSAESVSP